MFVNGNLVGTTSAGIQVPIAVDSEGKILISGLGITIGNKVTDYASLPTPAIDYDTQLWYVDNSTGLSWGKRKGWYESTGGAWERSSNQTFQVMDNEATISDNDDNTKKMDFQLDQITTGNTRTLTMSDRNLDLGNIDYIDMDTAVSPSHKEGRYFYDNVNKCLTVYNDETDSALQVGQEMWLRVKNESGATITNGQVVYISGSNGAPLVSLAKADSESTCDTVGVSTHSIENNSYGYVTTSGTIRGYNTSSFSGGDSLYLSTTVAGSVTNVKPEPPNCAIHLGHIGVVDSSNGTFFIKIAREYKVINPQNVITVAKSGADFTTIQGAHDSITDSSTTNRYVVQVAPGRYNERITPTDYVSTVGMGDAEDVVIYSDNKIIDITTQNHTSWYNLYLLLDTAVGNREVVEIDAGEHEFFHCKLEWTSTADSIRGWIIDLNGGEVELENCYVRYNNLSAVGGGSQNTWFDIDGIGKLDMQGCNVSMIQNNDASIRAIDDNSTVAGSMHIANCSFYIGITTTSYTSSCFFYRQNNAGSERVVNNCQIHLNNSSGVTGGGGIGFWLDNTGVVLHSHGNDIVITGFTNPRTFQIDLGATAHSSFDNIRNFQQTSIDGTLNINSVDYEVDTFWCSTDVQTNIDKAYYIGDKDTDDSWRFILDGDDLSFQRRESGTWVEKGGVDA